MLEDARYVENKLSIETKNSYGCVLGESAIRISARVAWLAWECAVHLLWCGGGCGSYYFPLPLSEVCLVRLLVSNTCLGAGMTLWIFSSLPGETAAIIFSGFLAVAVFWSLWLTRNERIFQHKMSFSPFQTIYRAFSLMLQWKPLVGAKKLSRIEDMMLKLDSKIKELNPGRADDGGRSRIA
jgi:hypothetical protein